MGSYVFKWPHSGAHHVYVTGTFDDWGKSEKLNKVGDVFEKEVNLPSAEEKVYYKFVVDDQWITDHAAPQEDDGHRNINNVLLPHEIKRSTSSTTGASGFSALQPVGAAANEQHTNGSVEKNTSQQTEAEDNAGPMPGGFPEPSADEDTFSVNPIPANPGSTVKSTATTSKEDYDRAGESQEAPAAENTFSVNPIPAYPGSTIESTATTSKEDYYRAGEDAEAPAEENTFSVKPIPATPGIGNPVQLAPGEKVPDPSEFTSNTVQSTATTSKEDYERAGETAWPMAGVAAAGATSMGALAASAFSVPEEKKNLIPESSLPMGSGAKDTLDQGPFISSVGPGSTTAALAGGMPLQQKRQGMVMDPDTAVPDVVKESMSQAQAEPEAAAYPEELESKAALEKELLSKTSPAEEAEIGSNAQGQMSGVPDVVQDSISKANEDPAAAAYPEQVQDKAALEKELLSKTHPVQQDADAPANTSKSQYSYYGLATGVPKPVEQSMAQAQAPPEAAADSSVVREKERLEQELLSKVSQQNEAGEPAPTLTAATSATAPTAAGADNSAAADATAITDGTTANETIPETDTATTTRGPMAGEVAGGAAVGALGAAGTADALERHRDADAEPPRIADSQKPDITTEAAPAEVSSRVSGPGKPFSLYAAGQSTGAAAAVADGMDAGEVPRTTTTSMPVVPENTEADKTEYAPPPTSTIAPGVSKSAVAAMSDGTEDPTLADEPAVRMMNQHETDVVPTTGTYTGETGALGSGLTSFHGTAGASTLASEMPQTTTTTTGAAPSSMNAADPYLAATLPATGTDSAATGLTAAPATPPKAATQTPATDLNSTPVTSDPAVTAAVTASSSPPATEAKSATTPSKPAAAGTASSASTPSRKMNETLRGSPSGSQSKEKKKKKNRISGFFKKIFD